MPVSDYLQKTLQIDSGWFSALATGASAVATILYFVATVVILCFVVLQYKEATRSRHAMVWLAMLQRYIEDPKIFTARGLINRHMNEINKVLPDLPRARSSRETIDQRAKELSDRQLTVDDIYLVLSALQNICLLVRHRFVSSTLGSELYAIVLRMWDLLEPIVRFERERRKADSEIASWFCDDFEKLALEMRSGGPWARQL